MIVYPDEFPIPLRATYAVDLNFLTRQTPMQGGLILQRRVEPNIFRDISLEYTMSLKEFYEWWAWAHRYGYNWHVNVIRGDILVFRYKSNIEFTYNDYGNVNVRLTAEHTIPEDGEFWDEAEDGPPNIYEPPVTAPDAPDNTGGATLQIDFKTSFKPFVVTLTAASQDFIMGTSNNTNAISSILVLSSSAIVMELYDNPPGSVLRATTDGFFRWHHDAPAQNSMFRLEPNTAYVLRVTGAVDDVLNIWGYTQ